MTRIEENKMLIEAMDEAAKRKPTGTYNEMVTFQLGAIASMLADISRSLAVIADKAESEGRKMKCIDCINNGVCCRWEDKKKGGCGLTDVRWIPVSERLPESDGVYIVSRWFSDGEESAILTDANYYDGCGEWYNDNRISWDRKLVTNKIVAWMPLPEPYKEG